MRFTFLGSGGREQIPRACCNCPVCTQARQLSIPYSRRTQSLYLHDLRAVFDTPECISAQLNAFAVPGVDRIFYSHFHPDHTMGCRIIEELREQQNLPPIDVFVPEDGIRISFQESPPILQLFQQRNLCRLHTKARMFADGITVERIPLRNGFAHGFLISDCVHTVFLCSCHAMHIPKNLPALFHADLMILGIGYFRSKDLSSANFSQDILPIITHYQPKRTIITHIEESDQLSYDDYLVLEKQYANLSFAYDGMEIAL